MPIYNTLPSAFNSMCLYLPALYINKYYSSTFAGYFHLTTLVLSVPIVFIGKSISEAMIQRVSEKKHNRMKIGRDVFKLMKTLGLISVVMAITIWIGGPFIFKIAFGTDYYISGVYAQIFVLLAAIRLVVSPLNNVIFFILEKNKIFAVWQTMYFLAILCLPFLTRLSFLSFVWAIVIISSTFYLIAFFIIRFIVIHYDKSL
jgi:O-antigen/teichoic acid export membrane protein